MISNLLLRSIENNNNNPKDKEVRNRYGYLAGIIGIIINLILFIIKLSLGLFTSSIAIMADAFNNLSDMASSVVTIIGFKLSSIPPDKEHPFGHGRLEYISALIVAFMVMLVGVQFVKSSLDRIFNPIAIKFDVAALILLLISIFLKLWLSHFNKLIGEKINSSALKAAAIDALGDVFTSSCVVVSFFISKFTDFPIDGYIGGLVALAILYAGFNLVKDTISPLLGEAPDEELVRNINQSVLSYENIIGVHDLIIHNYGVGRCMASIHAEIPANVDIIEIHDIIDTAEREISEKLEIYLVIHMDPVCTDCKTTDDIKMKVDEIINDNSFVKSIHDFRLIGDSTIIFDAVVNPENLKNIITEDELKHSLIAEIKKIYPNYECIITIDLEFI